MNFNIELTSQDRTVVIVGLAGTGKTTLAKWLQNKYPQYKLYHTDDYLENGLNIGDVIRFAASDEFKIIEGVQGYRLLRDGVENKFFPDLVINVMATKEVRGQRRPGMNYENMDALFRVIWMQYNKYYNPKPPRLIEIVNE